MTNKEAANFLSQVKFILLNSNSWLESTKTPIKESFDMAISALHAQTDGDCISRQAAIEETWKEPSYADPLNVLTEMRDRLMALPSAQPEPLVKESRTLVKDLVKEPCEDAVSREAAIDVAENAFVRGLLASPDIRKLPSAQPEPQWISVTERLPESKPEDLEYPTVIACCEDGEVMTACYYESTKEWGIGENYDRKINPVAWMPLPEPYRAERRTDE